MALVPASVQALQRRGVVYAAIQEGSTLVETVTVWRKENTSPILPALLRHLPGRRRLRRT